MGKALRNAVLVFGAACLIAVLQPVVALAQADYGEPVLRATATGLSEDVYAAYSAKLDELVSLHGEPRVAYGSYGASQALGVGYAELRDMDGDGAGELLVAYESGARGHDPGCDTFEVWRYEEGSLSCDYSGPLGGHGTNGYFPIVELFERADGQGEAYVRHTCLASSPAAVFAEELWGYRDGVFSQLGKRARMVSATGTTYYSDFGVYVSDVDEVSESEYFALFAGYLGDSAELPTVHAHLYGSGPGCDYDAKSVANVVAQAQSTISALAPYGEGRSPLNWLFMHRLYNRWTGEHFYTAIVEEFASLVSAGWRDEGYGWAAPLEGADVYRLYNSYAGDHHYTMSAEERDMLIGVGWSYEGVGWKSAGEDASPLYRQYNPNARAGAHNYTLSKEENDLLASVGWREEGVAWYGYATDEATAYADEMRSLNGWWQSNGQSGMSWWHFVDGRVYYYQRDYYDASVYEFSTVADVAISRFEADASLWVTNGYNCGGYQVLGSWLHFDNQKDSLICASLDGKGYSGSSSRHRADPPWELLETAAGAE